MIGPDPPGIDLDDHERGGRSHAEALHALVGPFEAVENRGSQAAAARIGLQHHVHQRFERQARRLVTGGLAAQSVGHRQHAAPGAELDERRAVLVSARAAGRGRGEDAQLPTREGVQLGIAHGVIDEDPGRHRDVPPCT